MIRGDNPNRVLEGRACSDPVNEGTGQHIGAMHRVEHGVRPVAIDDPVARRRWVARRMMGVECQKHQRERVTGRRQRVEPFGRNAEDRIVIHPPTGQRRTRRKRGRQFIPARDAAETMVAQEQPLARKVEAGSA